MRRSLVVAVAGLLLLPAFPGGAAPSKGTERAPPPPAQSPECVRHWPEARYRNLGYDHVVHVRNACRAAVVCRVSTDVNPTPIEVTVPAGEKTEVLTWRGSPAREFTPHVACRRVS